MRFLGIQNAGEGPLFQREHVEALALQLDFGRVADDIYEPFERMQAAEQVVVLAIGTGKEPGEMTKAGALKALCAFEALEGAHVLRADAVDENFVQFAAVACSRQRQCEHVPEWKAEIVDQDLAPAPRGR